MRFFPLAFPTHKTIKYIKGILLALFITSTILGNGTSFSLSSELNFESFKVKKHDCFHDTQVLNQLWRTIRELTENSGNFGEPWYFSKVGLVLIVGHLKNKKLGIDSTSKTTQLINFLTSLITKVIVGKCVVSPVPNSNTGNFSRGNLHVHNHLC